MRRPLVAGNWKMNGSRSMIGELLPAIADGIRADSAQETPSCDVLICPPAVYIDAVASALSGVQGISLGAQNVNAEPKGAHTGELSAAMLTDVGCSHVIVGHSERRQLYAETDEDVARKTQAALASGLTPVVCVGEQLEERDSGATESVVKRQLETVLHHIGEESAKDLIVAYEPVWAIGTGQTATPDQAQAVHAFLRGLLGTHGESVRILYGGSVKADNAASLFACDDIDGGLIGGASLQADDFVAIIRAA